MKKFFSSAITLTLVVFCAAGACAQEKGAVDIGNAEESIRQSLDAYVTAFNKGDAKSLATHWSEGGEYITSDGRKLRGRQELEADFSKYFAKSQGAKLELLETRITFMSPNVAIETGVARVFIPNQEAKDTEYEAIHIQTSGGWKLDSISEQELPASPPSHYQHLQSLEWMVGSWVHDDSKTSGEASDGDISVESICHWTTNRNYLVRNFKVYIQDRVDFEGTQIIGWDPHLSTIRSWLFDTDGGFGVGSWSHDETRWIVRTLNVLPDGRRGSATQIYEKLNDNKVLFRSIGRQVNGELLPNIEPITVSRMQE